MLPQLRQLCRHCHDNRSGVTLLTCCKCTKTASPWPNTGLICLARPCCAQTPKCATCAPAPAQRKLPVENRLGSGNLDPTSNKIKVLTMKVSKGVEFPVEVLPGVRHMPAPGRMRRKRRGCFMWWRPRRGRDFYLEYKNRKALEPNFAHD